jgi:hypothetical protein
MVAGKVAKAYLNAIAFGILFLFLAPIAAVVFLRDWGYELLNNSSEIKVANPCEGSVIGADDSGTRFVFYAENWRAASRQEHVLCILDVNGGPVTFSEQRDGYKHEVSLGSRLPLYRRFQPLPTELAKPFEETKLPRFQFNEHGLVIVREATGPRIEAAVLPYEDIGLEQHTFNKWPKDTFSAVYTGPKVSIERVYHDADEYLVTVDAGNENLASFELTMDPETYKEGLVAGNSVLIINDRNVSAYDFNGEPKGDDFCCIKTLDLVPGSPDLLISRGDTFKVWRLSQLGLR